MYVTIVQHVTMAAILLSSPTTPYASKEQTPLNCNDLNTNQHFQFGMHTFRFFISLLCRVGMSFNLQENIFT